MRKIKLYIFSFSCLTLFVLSLNKPFMEWWSDYRILSLKIPPTLGRYGDLYSASFLPRFMDTAATKLKIYTPALKSTDLYILHDSYLFGKIKKENFQNIDSLILSDFRGGGVYVQPNPKKRNILIIECSERTAGWRLTDKSVIFSKIRVGNSPALIKNPTYAESMQISKYFFNPLINQNLEFNLFDYPLFKKLKESKALINYTLFNRMVKDVVESTDKQYLFLNETVNPNLASSSFRFISNEEINNIVINLNLISRHYEDNGFDEIYFSIIPNPVSIIDAERLPYNHKIERIENNYLLETNYIDVYTIFKQRRNQIYRKDDSHWNNYGLQLWVYEVNTKILQP